jgi:hypothetical protein
MKIQYADTKFYQKSATQVQILCCLRGICSQFFRMAEGSYHITMECRYSSKSKLTDLTLIIKNFNIYKYPRIYYMVFQKLF